MLNKQRAYVAPQAMVIMGVSGCGKSTIGRAIANAGGLTFLDGDDLHSPQNLTKMASGKPLDSSDRTPWLESIVGAFINQDAAVIAASALRREYRDFIRSKVPQATFIHLVVSADEARRRVASRPDHFMPASLVETQLQALENLDSDEAGFEIDGTLPIELILETINRAID